MGGLGTPPPPHTHTHLKNHKAVGLFRNNAITDPKFKRDKTFSLNADFIFFFIRLTVIPSNFLTPNIILKTMFQTVAHLQITGSKSTTDR